jgi:uncharacterized protein (TIGR03546 family)
MIPKPIKKWIAVFRGDVAPVLIVLSATLGMWFGMMPGFYGLHLAILLVAVVVNIHIGLFILWAAIGKAAALAAAPLLYHTGVWAHAGLGSVFALLAGIPIVGVTDFSRFAVAGAMVAGPAVGVLCGLLLARSVKTFRRNWLKLEDNSEAFKRWRQKGWVKLLDRILIGKSADVRAVLDKRPKYIRIVGVVLAIVLFATASASIVLVRGDVLQQTAGRLLSQVNGAQVDLAGFDLAPLDGRLTVDRVEATDARAPARNRFQTGTLTADVSLWHLATGRLVLDEIEVSDVALDQPRDIPGEVLRSPVPEEDAPFDGGQFDLPDVDVAKLETLFQNAKDIRDKLQRIGEWLPVGGKTAEESADSVPESYLAYLRARASSPVAPRIVLRRVELQGVALSGLGTSNITCTELSDAPRANRQPLGVDIHVPASDSRVHIVFHHENADGGAEISAELKNIELQQLQQELRPQNPIVFENGTASAVVEGRASRSDVDLRAAVVAKDLQVRSAGDGLLDLDPQLAREAASALRHIETELRIVGPPGAPRVAFDGPGIGSALQAALVDAGKAELARRLNTALGDRLPEGVPELSDPAAVGEAAKSALGNLIEGATEEEDSDAEGEDGSIKDKLGGLLKGGKPSGDDD